MKKSGDAGGVAEGDVFTIAYTAGGVTHTVAFEFDADRTPTDPASGNWIIPFDYSQTHEQIAEATVAAIRAVVHPLDSTVHPFDKTMHLGDGFIQLREANDSGLDSYVLDTAASRVWQTGRPGVEGELRIQLPNDLYQIQVPAGGGAAIVDDETFLIDDGTTAVTFQFDLNRSGPTRSRYVTILPTGTESQDELARLIQDAIAGAFPTLLLSYQGAGRLDFTVPPGGSMDTSGTANLSGTVRSGIADGQTFQISRAGSAVTFEFDTNSSHTAGNIQVGLAPTSNGDAVARAMVTAIQGASLGLTPVYLGRGTIDLNETPQHTFDPRTSGLTVSGVPGGAVAIEYIPSESFTAENMAGVIISAINRTGFSSFVAMAKLRGGRTIFLDGAQLDPANPNPAQAIEAVTAGSIQAEFVPGICDHAGNFLKPNQPDGETRFTIILGQASFDFGDLADDPEVSDDFRTLLVSNGAQHVQLKDSSLRLGSRLDTESDGQPTAAADGDDAGAFVDLSGAPPLSLSLLPLSTVQAPDAWHITDNGTFLIDNGAHEVTFTMNLGGGMPPALYMVPVPYFSSDGPEEIAHSVVLAIQAAVTAGDLAGVTVVELDNGLLNVAGAARISMGAGLTLASTAPLVFQVPGNPAAGDEAEITDGGTFQVRQGATTVTFTFDLAGGTGASHAVVYYPGETPEILARRIVQAIQGEALAGTLPGVSAAHLGSGAIEIVGADELMLGGGLQPYQRLPIRIDAAAAMLLADGDQFQMSDGSQAAVTFEFDNETPPALLNEAHRLVTLGPDAATTAANMAAAIQSAIDAGLLQGLAVSVAGTLVSLVPQTAIAGGPLDDEDGVRFESIFTKGFATPITVTASGNGLLDAWMDWNNNGRFDGGAEQVFANQPVFAGENRLTITTPLDVDDTLIPFYTLARFRLSQGGGLPAYGLGVGGEVEDYRIRIMTNTPPVLLAPLADYTVLEDAADDIYNLALRFADDDVTNGNGDNLTYSVTLEGFASAVTDLGTAGAVHVRFEARQFGNAGNAIQVMVTQSNHGDNSGPAVTVSGNTIAVDVNTNALNPTTAQQLVDAVNADAAASALVSASIVRGVWTQDISGTDTGAYSPIRLATSLPVAYPLAGSQLTLDYLPDQNGKVVLVMTAADQTFTAVSDTVTITISAVNDAPSFDAGTNPVEIAEDAGLYKVDSWATNLQPGPAAAVDESIQALQFHLTVLSSGTLQAADFTVLPAIDAATGQLTFQVAPNANGIAYVVVTLQDDGGTALGGDDTSPESTLTITVNPINDPPVLTLQSTFQATDEDQVLVFNAGNGNAISVSDLDAAEAAVEELRVTLSVLQGTLTLSTTAGLTFTAGDGTADTAMTFRGSQAAINAALSGLQYLPRVDFNGTDTLTVTVNDLGNFGSGPAPNVTRTVNLTVRPVNDDPTVTLPGTPPVTLYTVYEDTNLPLPGIVVGDAKDSAYAPVTLKVTLTALHGTVTVNTNVSGGVGVGGVQNNGSSSASLTGTPAAINATLAHATGIVYKGLLNYNNYSTDQDPDADEVLLVTVDDLGNVGSGGAKQAQNSVTISVLQANDAPSITSPGPRTLDEDAPNYYIPLAVTDVDADESPVDPLRAVTLVLKLTDGVGNLLTTAGTLTVRTNVPGGLDPDPSSPTYNGTLTGNGTAQLTITGSPAKITETLRDATGLHFLPAADFNGSLQMVATVQDHGNSGGGASLSQTVTIPITVDAVNDPPVVTVPVGPFAVDEGVGASRLISGVGVTDVDAGVTPPGHIALTLTVPAGQGVLNVTPDVVGGVPASRIVTNGSSTVTLTGTPAEINLTLSLPRGVTYTVPDGDFNKNRAGGDVILTVTANDQGRTGKGGAQTDLETVAITVRPVNDLPVITVPAPQSLTEGPGASRPIAGIQITDVDFEELGAGDLTVTVSIPAGRGTLNVATGVVGGVTTITGNGTETVTLVGRINQINATLAAATGVTYTVPNGDFNELNNGGPVVLTITTNDQGRTGDVSGVDVTGAVPITVIAINDDPTISAPAPTQASALVFDEDTPVEFSAATNREITVADVDLAESADNSMDVTIAADDGTFKLSTTAGLISHGGDGTGHVTLRGSLAAVNGALAGAVFTPTADFNGPTTLQITVNDRGNTSSSGSAIGRDVSRTIHLRFTAKNDIPVILVNPDSLTTAENSSLPIQAIQIIDPDVSETPGGELLVTLRVSHGTLTVRDDLGTQYLKPGDISGNGTGTVFLAASPDEINNTLTYVSGVVYGLIYQPNPQYFGPDQVDVDADDQGLTGLGGRGFVQGSLAITVVSVNNPPVLSVPSAKTMQEDSTLLLPGISVSDEDAGNAVIQVRLNASQGKLLVTTVPGPAGVPAVIDNDSPQVTLEGTMPAINATLGDPNGLRYTPNANANGVEYLVVVADDLGNLGGTNLPETDTKTVTITISAVNDAPQVTVPVPPPEWEVNEDTSQVIAGVSVADFDAAEGTGQVRVTATVVNGTLTVSPAVPNGVPAANILANGSSSITMTGTPDQINTTLAGASGYDGLTYRGQLNYFGPDQLVVRVNDQGNFGSGGPLEAIAMTAITVVPVNDPPIAAGDSLTMAERHPTDPGRPPLTVAGDVLTSNDTPGPANETSSQTVRIVAVGGASQGTVSYDGSNVIYTPPAHFNGTATFTYTIADDGVPAETAVGTVTVTVRAVNDPPVPQSDTGATNEDTATTFTASQLLANDAKGPAAPAGTVDDEGSQVLTLSSVSPLSAAGGTVTLSGGIVRYTPPANFNGPDTFTYRVTDDGLTNGQIDRRDAIGTVTVTVAAVNDGPQVIAPTSASVNEDQAGQIGDVSVSDIDVGETPAPGGRLAVTLSVSHGTLTVNVDPDITGGLRAGDVADNGTAVVSISGTPQQINATFDWDNGLTYLSGSNYNGTDHLIVTVNDGGQTGLANPASPSTVTRTITLTINAVNDAPEVTVPSGQTVPEDETFHFGAIQVSDVDADDTPGATVRVTLTVDHGVLSVNTAVPGGLVTGNVANNNSRSVVLTGSLAAMNATLGNVSGVLYRPNTNFFGSDTVNVTVNDLGNTGHPGPQTTVSTFTITVTAVNDAPLAVNDPAVGEPLITTDEDTVLKFVGRGVLANDIDVDGDDLSVVIDGKTPELDPVSGKWNYQITSNRGAPVVIDVEEGTFIFNPTGVAVFQALRAGQTLTDTFSYRASDGHVQSNLATVTITVTGVNDPPVAGVDKYTVADNAVLDSASLSVDGLLAN
ncbi:MAG TPA: tandem-95 repeat protein, partial [Candidatus Anammoximicrobium sp.]|nr:tandem-95 repeat protein [Candidatus Anammoximicrobium sp.]